MLSHLFVTSPSYYWLHSFLHLSLLYLQIWFVCVLHALRAIFIVNCKMIIGFKNTYFISRYIFLRLFGILQFDQKYNIIWPPYFRVSVFLCLFFFVHPIRWIVWKEWNSSCAWIYEQDKKQLWYSIPLF